MPNLNHPVDTAKTLWIDSFVKIIVRLHVQGFAGIASEVASANRYMCKATISSGEGIKIKSSES